MANRKLTPLLKHRKQDAYATLKPGQQDAYPTLKRGKRDASGIPVPKPVCSGPAEFDDSAESTDSAG